MIPKVLILLQTKNAFVDLIELNLKKNNYNVSTFPCPDQKTLKINLWVKLLNFITFPFYKNGNYISAKQNKYNLINHKNNDDHLQKIYQEKYDYTLVFRADEYDDDLLLNLKQNSKKMIAFHWDGLKRTPNIFSKIKYFDTFFSFDPMDAINNNLKFITNFYFDVIDIKESKKTKWDLTYIGYFTTKRFDILHQLSDHNSSVITNFILKAFSHHDRLLLQSSNTIKDLHHFYTYSELLKIHNESNVILDLKADIHDGLSFRFFECIQLNKKIVTTNTHVKKYDFYNPNNILVLNDNLDNDIKEFINTPFVDYTDDIKNKYSFSNWFENIIESKNCIPIHNPYLNV